MGGDLIVRIVSVAATAHLHISFTSTSPPCSGGTSFGFRLASSLGRMYFFVWTPLGQELENAALRGADQVLRENLTEAQERLARITIWSLAGVTALVGLVSLVRKNFVFAVVNAGIIGVSLGVTQVLKRFILPRPYLIEASDKFIHNSFPSGHTTIAMAVFLALLIVSAWRFRALMLFLFTPYVGGIGAWTLAAKWHRFSDTLGANAILLAVACCASVWLAQNGYLREVPRKGNWFRVLMLSAVVYAFLQTSARQPSALYATGTLLLIIAPYIIATLAIATLLVGDDLLQQYRVPEAQRYLIGLGLLTLLFARQMISLRDNQRLIHHLKDANQKLHKEATTDHLTGLLNRSAFTTQLEQFVQDKIAGSLLFLDLNRFKAVNDTYGHAAGDALLKSVASRIVGQLRAEAWIASRAGGGEFMVALPGADPETGDCFAAEVKRALEQPHDVGGGQQVTVRVAVGTAHYPLDSEHLDTIIDTADMRMYEMKREMRADAPSTKARGTVL